MNYHGYYANPHGPEYVLRLGNRLLKIDKDLRFKEIYTEPPWEFFPGEGVVPDFDIKRPPATYYCRYFAWCIADGWFEFV